MPTRRYGSHTVETSNEDKVLFPDARITKGEIIEYHEKIAPLMIRHIQDRPLSFQRYPDGIDNDGFYQQDAKEHFPDWIETVRVPSQDGDVSHVVVRRTADLAYLANLGVITVHAWLSRRATRDYPDMFVFDLDPPDSGGFDAVRTCALDLKRVMEDVGLTPYVKTTGSKGLHVVCPIRPERSFDDVRRIAHRMAGYMADAHPDRYTTEQRKDDRCGRLYLDVGRNAAGQTVVAPYSLRARPAAPVAAPLSWDEVRDRNQRPDTYTLGNVLRRLGQKDDPWMGMHRHAARLDAAAKAFGSG